MALRTRGIPKKIVPVIESLYNGAKYRVLYNGTLSAHFVVGSGLRQGCILSPVLKQIQGKLNFAVGFNFLFKISNN